MIPKVLRFLFYILIAISLRNCEKATKSPQVKLDNSAEIKRLTDLGDQFYQTNQYDSSYYYFNKAKIACDPKRHSKQFVYAISNLATIQQTQGDYIGSENTVMEAIPILENSTNDQYKWNIYTILGINYLNTEDYENALLYFNRALNLKTDIVRKNGSRNNIALTYIEKNEVNKAIAIYNDILSHYAINQNPKEYSRILTNIGQCLIKKDIKSALPYLVKSLKIRLIIKDEVGLIASYYNLSKYYKPKNQNLAIESIKMAYEIAINLSSTNDQIECLKVLIDLSNGRELKNYSLQYVHLNDSITKARQIAINQFAKIKYDSKKEKDENLTLKTEKAERELLIEKQQNNNLILYILTIIGIGVTIFLFYVTKEKNKKEKIQTAYNTEIRISKKLHDELANDLYQTMSFAETQDLSTADNKEILLENLETIYSRTRNISKENNKIDTGSNYTDNLKNLIGDFNTQSINIIVNDMESIEWTKIEPLKKIIIYRVLQELLVNMKKHSQCSVALISFKNANKSININYSDNGVGISQNTTTVLHGLQNMESRVNSVKGRISFNNQSRKGYKINIELPL